jgi:hypothetical protein
MEKFMLGEVNPLNGSQISREISLFSCTWRYFGLQKNKYFSRNFGIIVLRLYQTYLDLPLVYLLYYCSLQVLERVVFFCVFLMGPSQLVS